MLGSITRSLSEVFTRLGTLPFTAESKLDGQRVQIHARTDGPQGEDDGGGRWVQGDDGAKVWVRLFSRCAKTDSSLLIRQTFGGHDGEIPGRMSAYPDPPHASYGKIAGRFPEYRFITDSGTDRPTVRFSYIIFHHRR